MPLGSIFVVLFNFIIRDVNSYLISKVGVRTKSHELKRSLKAIFIGTVLNTGILTILVDANLRYAPYFLKKIPLNGTYVDYDLDWYSYFSQSLPLTMIIQALAP